MVYTFRTGENKEILNGIFPGCCQSASCGEWDRSQCEKCRNYPILQEWDEWVKKHNAKQLDEIWYPSVFTACKVGQA